MKVYVITSGEYSDYGIQAVTLNREKAELICAINNRNIRYSEDRSKIEEYDTDEIQCESIGDVGICYTAKFDYKALEIRRLTFEPDMFLQLALATFRACLDGEREDKRHVVYYTTGTVAIDEK